MFRNPGFGGGTVKLSVKIPPRLSKKISSYVAELNNWVHREGETELTDELLRAGVEIDYCSPN